MNAVLAYDQEQYGKLCRDELEPSPKYQATLRCRYVTNNVPYLKIGPIKLEELSLDPYIVVYHDVIYDAEIEYLKEESKPKVRLFEHRLNCRHKSFGFSIVSASWN